MPRSLDSWSVPILLVSTILLTKVNAPYFMYRELATSLGFVSMFEHTSWS
jgi:hypothetical protein